MVVKHDLNKENTSRQRTWKGESHVAPHLDKEQQTTKNTESGEK